MNQDVSPDAIGQGAFEIRPDRLARAALPVNLGSTDCAEGPAAFAERRPPRFTEIVP